MVIQLNKSLLRDLGTLNQGRRVNKSSAILIFKNNVLLILIAIIIQVNVLESDQWAHGGIPPSSGYEKTGNNGSLTSEILYFKCYYSEKN
jgi:hypothetical protein